MDMCMFKLSKWSFYVFMRFVLMWLYIYIVLLPLFQAWIFVITLIVIKSVASHPSGFVVPLSYEPHSNAATKGVSWNTSEGYTTFADTVLLKVEGTVTVIIMCTLVWRICNISKELSFLAFSVSFNGNISITSTTLFNVHLFEMISC